MPRAIARAGLLLALAASASSAQTEFPFAAGTDRTGRAQALSDAAGRVMIESPEFPRGLWVHLADEAEQALPGIQVAYQGRPDSLVAIWAADPSGLRQETLLWTRPGGDPPHVVLRPSEPADLPAGLTSIDWWIDPDAEELLELEEGPELLGWQGVTAFLQERWQGRMGRGVVQIDSSTVLAADLARPELVARLVEHLQDETRRSMPKGTWSAAETLAGMHPTEYVNVRQATFSVPVPGRTGSRPTSRRVTCVLA